MSSGFQEGGGGESIARELHAEPAPARAPAGSPLLDQVLKATMALGRALDDSSSPPLEPLLAVARRRPGEGMSVEPVARELVEAVLVHEFAGQPKLLEVIPTMSTRLASTLLDDPVSRGRMMRMWDRLQEAAR